MRGGRRYDAALVTRLDRLLLLTADLRGSADLDELGQRMARAACDLLDGAGALTHVQGPGRVAIAGRHGTVPDTVGRELSADTAIDDAFRGHTMATAERVVTPVPGAVGVTAVLDVHRPGRFGDPTALTLLALLAQSAGYALDQVMGYTTDSDLLDPNAAGAAQRVTAAVASLRPGDGLLAVELDQADEALIAAGGAAVDLALVRLGIYLRSATRPPGDLVARSHDYGFVVVLRDLKAPVDVIALRLLQEWLAGAHLRSISIGAAVHAHGSAPMTTQERAQWALASARDLGGARLHVAPDVPPAAVAS